MENLIRAARAQAFLSGFGKGLLVSGVALFLVWVVAVNILSSPAFIFIVAPLAAFGIWPIVVPMAVAVTLAFIDRSNAQLLGALAVYPVLVATVFGVRFIEKERLLAEIEIARSSLDPRYLQRTIDNPIGRIETLALLGRDWCTTSICPLALADGVAERIVILGPSPGVEDNRYERNPLKGENLWVEKTFLATQGEACFFSDNKPQVFWVQKVGLFGTCIIEEGHQFVLEDAILVLDTSDGYQYRPNGLKGYSVSAAYEVTGNIVREFARWEMGALGWHGPRMGEKFEPIEFLRALTDTKPNRVAEAATLTLPQRIDAAHAGIGKAPIDISAVISYLRTAPPQALETSQQGSNGRLAREEKIQLDDERTARLRAVAEEACTLRPSRPTKRFGYSAECVRDFNNFVDRLFNPAAASVLRLPTPV